MNPRLEQSAIEDPPASSLKNCQVGIGAWRSRRCWRHELASSDRRRGTVINPLAPKKPHFAAKAKRVIYLHLTGSPPHLDLYDYKPRAGQAQRRAVPRLVPQGQAIRLHLRHAEAARHAAQLRPARQGGRLAVRRHSAPARRGRRAVRHQVDVHRPVQPRPGRAVALHRLAPCGPALDGLLGHLRPGHRRTKICPASSC